VPASRGLDRPSRRRKGSAHRNGELLIPEKGMERERCPSLKDLDLQERGDPEGRILVVKGEKIESCIETPPEEGVMA